MVRRWAPTVFASVLLACGSDPAPTSPPAPSPPPPSAPSTAPPPTATSAPPTSPATPPSDPALDALLPEPTPPISLAHARALSREGTWLEAAAVYDALVHETPTEARYLAGRGFSLASSEREGTAVLARADYTRALALATDDAMRALVHYDLGLLDEHAGLRDDAHGHYAEAHRLHPSRASTEALARTGGEPESAAVRCELELAASATSVADLRAVLALLVRTEEQDYLEDEPPQPATEEEAAALLCHDHPCDVTHPFVSDFVLSSSVFEAHVVVPRPSGGYWVIPRVGPIANGIAARCPDELLGEGAASLERPGASALARLRVRWLENDWNECFGDEPDDDGEECLDGCWWDARKDLEILVDAESGRYVIGAARRALDEATDEGPSLLPEAAFVMTERGLTFTACGRHDPVVLGP
ncbi:MAG: hypothetical protein K1X94_26415 [Sandaracinaceae bacterium]|nr:hypothetical protein [Sandaracinaceae bacterium]